MSGWKGLRCGGRLAWGPTVGPSHQFRTKELEHKVEGLQRGGLQWASYRFRSCELWHKGEGLQRGGPERAIHRVRSWDLRHYVEGL